ncbi:MAG: hypothetical protein KDD16_06930 [Mangrovimonas sp.]|nr:hypothetical protein [Mangrovimonas sp.]
MKSIAVPYKFSCLVVVLFSLLSCSSDNDEPNGTNPNEPENPGEVIDIPPGETLPSGSAVFHYEYTVGGFTKSLDIYYYLPNNYAPTTPVLFVFHGTGRNADEYRDAMVAKAQELNFMVFAPEFSIQEFPDGDAYNLGNVYVDGDNPTLQTLNPESQWAFSIVDPLFDYIKTLTGNENASYYAFGHSAGGQFLHRLLMFKPNSRIEKAVASASGWYTFPDETVPFPYGFGQSILSGSSLESLFSKQVIIQVGEDDDNPNSAGLRHNDYADAQGLNRKTRAVNFFDYCSDLASEESLIFNWQFRLVPNATHDFGLPCEYAADVLFN